MKWFVFVLLTANILYFSWEYNALLRDSMKRATHDQPIPQQVESLKLLRELDLPQTPRARTGPAVGEDPERRDEYGKSIKHRTSERYVRANGASHGARG